MQEDVTDTETVYKELLLLSNELKLIKKNQIPSQALDESIDIMAGNQKVDRANSISQSEASQDLENIMMVPDDMAFGEQGDEYDDTDVFD